VFVPEENDPIQDQLDDNDEYFLDEYEQEIMLLQDNGDDNDEPKPTLNLDNETGLLKEKDEDTLNNMSDLENY
jgi:hypothetical protein